MLIHGQVQTLLNLPIVTSNSYMKRKWENSLTSNEMPAIQDLRDFLKHRCRSLENLQTHKVSEKTQANNKVKQTYKSSVKFINIAINAQFCSICKEVHSIFTCPVLLALQGKKRYGKIKTLNLCTNCLRENYKASQCRSGSCKHCKRRHHSLLNYSTLIDNNKYLSHLNATNSANFSANFDETTTC